MPDALPPAPSRRGRRRPGAARALNREALVDAAMAILDAEGLEAISMRRVAAALGTGPASLYAHVEDKDELVALVLDRAIGEFRPPAPDRERWQEQVKACVRETRRVYTAHRDLARANLGIIPTGPNALRAIEGTLAVLRASPLDDQTVAYASDLLAQFAIATAFEASLWQERMTDADALRWLEELRDYWAALPPDRFPNLVALAGPLMSGGTSDERFEFGLDVLVRGLAALGGEA